MGSENADFCAIMGDQYQRVGRSSRKKKTIPGHYHCPGRLDPEGVFSPVDFPSPLIKKWRSCFLYQESENAALATPFRDFPIIPLIYFNFYYRHLNLVPLDRFRHFFYTD